MVNDIPVVYLVDDDTAFRASMSFLLEAAGFKTVATGSAEEFLELDVIGAGCIVLDLAMPGMSGIDLQSLLAERGVNLPIVFLTAHGELRTGVRAMRAGAEDFLSKPVSATELIDAIQRALARDKEQRQRTETRGAVAARMARLTARETDVLRLVVAGLRNKQIAGELGLALQTVKFHRGHIMEKLGALNVADLVRMVGPLLGATRLHTD